ncbi:MAG: hypothetical protein P8Y77_10325 [Nitrospirota bacterium]|jgi:hypothetical protein
MKGTIRKLSLVFSAGAFGGLVNSIAVWAFGAAGVAAALGVRIAPALTPGWLYPRLVWGGIWGALFLIPVRASHFARGLLWSLGPSAVQLFVVFPVKAHKGMMGLELGALAPLFVLFYNALWGIGTAYWLKYMGEAK